MSNTTALIIKSLDEQMVARKTMFTDVAPPNYSVERLRRQVSIIMAENDKVAKCSPTSIITSCMRIAELGLDLSKGAGQAYLVPYATECTLIIGYRGYIELAYRTNKVRSVQTGAVMEGDAFDYGLGSDPFVNHKPEIFGDRGNLIAVYAVARMKTGETMVDIMRRDEIDRVKKASRAGTRGPWVDHFTEMARKTVARRLAKYLPTDNILSLAMEYDADEPEIVETQTATAKLADDLEGSDT